MDKRSGLACKENPFLLLPPSGKNSIELENEYKKVGDIGKVAEIASKSKPQSVLFSEPLTVERVYETLEKISNVTGSKSIETKIRYLNNIIADSEPIEAKYIMRTVVGKLRLGIADQTVLDALAEAFTEDKKNKNSNLPLISNNIGHSINNNNYEDENRSSCNNFCVENTHNITNDNAINSENCTSDDKYNEIKRQLQTKYYNDKIKLIRLIPLDGVGLKKPPVRLTKPLDISFQNFFFEVKA